MFQQFLQLYKFRFLCLFLLFWYFNLFLFFLSLQSQLNGALPLVLLVLVTSIAQPNLWQDHQYNAHKSGLFEIHWRRAHASCLLTLIGFSNTNSRTCIQMSNKYSDELNLSPSSVNAFKNADLEHTNLFIDWIACSTSPQWKDDKKSYLHIGKNYIFQFYILYIYIYIYIWNTIYVCIYISYIYIHIYNINYICQLIFLFEFIYCKYKYANIYVSIYIIYIYMCDITYLIYRYIFIYNIFTHRYL